MKVEAINMLVVYMSGKYGTVTVRQGKPNYLEKNGSSPV
jgi:hypothetical protein